MLSLDDHWVWDFWLADDGESYHLFFLYAPTSLQDETKRHRAARIGHATSPDLRTWERVADPFTVGTPESFDATATWTGSIVRADDGTWLMFYTGSRFLAEEPNVANIESIGVASSGDLITWVKHDGPVTTADPRWYETWGSSTWKEEAWRDPWVYPDPAGDGHHMLVTARANHGDIDSRGVIGYAHSRDLANWEVRAPLSAPGAGFQHVEVPQIVDVDGNWVLLFSCPAHATTPERAARFPDVGTWAVVVPDPTGPFDMSAAVPLTPEALYSARLIRQRDGSWALLAFENQQTDGTFDGRISDPIPFTITADGTPTIHLAPCAVR